ncbi:probable serine/threonine-protein kinase nek3 isoform X2 [Phymastichus coffea]|uniref:probable serine/threonine-protein kinase nek3 isoform X2 n=1 Tax=Phymastichus coffea TaxID=108790 RepID=UPI00273AF923|nr:probable serine/threonine-protein kinase nek3 isoform X2 [Phymastichus coffea]
MSPRRTRRGTIRQSVMETSIDSSLKNTSKITKKSHRANKSHAKVSEDESENLMEVYSSQESVASTSILNQTSSKVKKTRRGVKASESQDISLSVTIEEPKKNAKTPRAKRQITRSKSQTKESQTLLSKKESDNVKLEKRVSYNLISDNEESSGVSLRKIAKSSKGANTPEESPERGSLKNISSDKNVTPKTSPALNVSFTPHRSKKTPRKSPVNLGSPKTRSPNPVKFLIKPRKLSIVDSPTSSENSLHQNNSLNDGNESIQNTNKSSMNSKSKLNVISSKKKTISPFKPRPTFSKSPKIVLKTPKAKSKKSALSKQKKSSVKSDKASKSLKSTIDESLSVTDNTSGLINFNETITVSPSKSLNKSANTSVSPGKSPKMTSPAKSKLELLSSSLTSVPKIILSSVSMKTKPKTKFACIPKGTPKIVLTKKSPVKSTKKTSPMKSKSSSPSKVEKFPSKSENTSVAASQELSKVPSSIEISLKSTPAKLASPTKFEKSLLISKSKKSPTKSVRSSLNTSSKKMQNTSLSNSKMPKIVLKKKSPQKSLKSATPASAKKTLKVTSASKSIPVSNVNKVPSKQQSRTSSPTKNTSKNTTMSPKVVMSKLSSPELKNNNLRAKENQPSVTLVPVDHETHKLRVSSGRSPKSPKIEENKKSSPVKSARYTKSMTRSIAASTDSKAGTPTGILGNKFFNLKPKNTSTPRERSKVTKSPLGKSKIIKRLNQSTIKGNQPFLEDESEPSLDNSSLIRMSDVFDIDTPRKNNTFDKNSSNTKSPKSLKKLDKNDTFETGKSPKNTSQRSNRSGTFEVSKSSSSGKNKSKINDTYEINEPKTPGLKRTIKDAELDLNAESSAKKSRKVNFTSPARESVRASSINRIGTPAHPRKTPITVGKTKTSLFSSVRSRISSLVLANKTPASTPLNKRSSITDSNKSKSNYAAQLASVNRLSRSKNVTDSHKKIVTKTPVSRKIPNFAEIHQKNFAKMESLVDLKKRVEKRHIILNAGSAKKATESTNGAYNRFGFKVRKNEAVNLVSKKQTASADSRQQKRENARSTLQGVRMNRRFELQMKARIKTS